MSRVRFCLRGTVLQGVFVRPPALSALQAKRPGSTAQRRPGMEAFRVDLPEKSGGWPLPRDIQAKMEGAFGVNFSDVRVHIGPEAAAIGALAFTWGSNIHFAQGQYNPHTPEGLTLLGHELAHVVQQRAGRVSNPFGSGVAVVQDHALEAEADRLGKQAAAYRPPAEAAVINRKANPAAVYTLRAPQITGSGWQISIGTAGAPQAIGSLQMQKAGNSVCISDLQVAPEHRRHGLAGRLLDAAMATARSSGFASAHLEAKPDSPDEVPASALISMYQRYGFRMRGVSEQGNPLMERRL